MLSAVESKNPECLRIALVIVKNLHIKQTIDWFAGAVLFNPLNIEKR